MVLTHPSISQSVGFSFFFSYCRVTPLKPLNKIPLNVKINKDIICRCANLNKFEGYLYINIFLGIYNWLLMKIPTKQFINAAPLKPMNLIWTSVVKKDIMLIWYFSDILFSNKLNNLLHLKHSLPLNKDRFSNRYMYTQCIVINKIPKFVY